MENNFVVLEGPANTNDSKTMAKAIKQTQKQNKPIKDFSRIIIQTNEENPKVLAVVTNDNFEVANGYAVRAKPVYRNK